MYEYKVVRASLDLLQRNLNKWAEEGWRTVSVQHETSGVLPSALVVLEKVRPEAISE